MPKLFGVNALSPQNSSFSPSVIYPFKGKKTRFFPKKKK
jgi:hypothetical protein